MGILLLVFEYESVMVCIVGLECGVDFCELLLQWLELFNVYIEIMLCWVVLQVWQLDVVVCMLCVLYYDVVEINLCEVVLLKVLVSSICYVVDCCVIVYVFGVEWVSFDEWVLEKIVSCLCCKWCDSIMYDLLLCILYGVGYCFMEVIQVCQGCWCWILDLVCLLLVVGYYEFVCVQVMQGVEVGIVCCEVLVVVFEDVGIGGGIDDFCEQGVVGIFGLVLWQLVVFQLGCVVLFEDWYVQYWVVGGCDLVVCEFVFVVVIGVVDCVVQIYL